MQVDKIDPQSAGRGLLVLFTALLFRMIGVVFAVSGGNLNKKEKIFMAFAWLPKAAVQVSGVGDYYEWWKCFCRRQLVRFSLTILSLLPILLPIIIVQAAIGPVFLDNARKFNKPEWEPMGREILTLAVWKL